MPQNTIAQIKEILQAPGQLSYVENPTLGGLLDRLQTELLSLPQDQQAQARQIAKLTKEKVQMMQQSQLATQQSLNLDDLEQAVLSYEINHPPLTNTIRSICHLLSNIGI